MTREELKQLFEEYNDDFLEFDKVEDKRSQRADLHAFMLLDSLLPSRRDIVSSAEHDEIYLEPDLDDLAAVVTPEQVLELVRCGVRYGDYGICMYV